jgi:hypothetical protein
MPHEPADVSHLPQCTDSEMYLLGFLIMEPAYVEDVGKYITGKDFAHTKHQVLFEAIQQITKDTKAQSGDAHCDPVLLVSYLETKQMYALCGGQDYIGSLVDCRATVANFQHHARKIRDYAQLRRIAEMNDRFSHQIRTGAIAITKDTTAFLRHASRSYQQACEPMRDPNLILESGPTLVMDHVDTAERGEYRTAPTPWPVVDNLTQPFLPGSVVLLCGAPGSAKSYMALQIVAGLLDRGYYADLMALESGRRYHIIRRMVQITGDNRLGNAMFVEHNGPLVRHYCKQHEEHLTLLGQHLYSEKDITYRGVVDWAITRFKAGSRLVCIDPITKARGESGKAWNDDKQLMTELEAAAVEYRASVLMVIHPKVTTAAERKGPPSQDDMAGGAAFSRFCTANFTLVKHAKPHTIRVSGKEADTKESATHFVYVGKARDGSGCGMFGMTFNPNTLTFEGGAVVKQDLGEKEEVDTWSV